MNPFLKKLLIRILTKIKLQNSVFFVWQYREFFHQSRIVEFFLESVSKCTVCGYKFNQMATKLTTLTAFRSASLKGRPVLLEGTSENKYLSHYTNKVGCF